MKVILTEDVPDVGKMGDAVEVRDGFARNFLLPQGKALKANTNSVRQLEHTKRLVEAERKRRVSTA